MGSRSHRRTRSRACIVGLIALTACRPPGVGVTDPVAGVPVALDGDSLRVSTADGDLEVRLDGINAPEAGECLADEARTRLQQLADPSVEIEPTGSDQYGRTLALVRNAGTLLNQAMVAEGLAIATTGGPWSEVLVPVEDEARSAETGIWNPSACGPSVDADLQIEFTSPDPPGADDPNDEGVTVHNAGSTSADLSGFVLRDESSANRFTFPAGSVLGPGESITVWTGCEATDGATWCSPTPIWNNGGDSALVLSTSGNVVAHARYDPDR